MKYTDEPVRRNLFEKGFNIFGENPIIFSGEGENSKIKTFYEAGVPSTYLQDGDVVSRLNIVDGYIQSDGFVSGETGWQIKSDGTLEANTGIFRGELSGASGTFGTINGGTVYSNASGVRVGLEASSRSVVVYNDTTLIGSMGMIGSNMIIGSESGGGSFFMKVAGTNILEVSATALKPNTDGGISLGTSLKRFNEGNFSGGVTCAGITSAGSIVPNGVYSLGTSGNRWNEVNANGITCNSLSGNCAGSHSGSFSGTVTASGGQSGTWEVARGIHIDKDASDFLKSNANNNLPSYQFTFSSGILTGVGTGTIAFDTY